MCKNHHTLLHLENGNRDSITWNEFLRDAARGDYDSHQPLPKIVSVRSVMEQVVFIATARVRIVDNTGHFVVLKALLNTATDASLITEAAAQSLNLTSTSARVPIIRVYAHLPVSLLPK